MEPTKAWYERPVAAIALIAALALGAAVQSVLSDPSTSSAVQPPPTVVALPDVQPESQVGGVSAPIIEETSATPPGPKPPVEYVPISEREPSPPVVAPTPVVAPPNSEAIQIIAPTPVPPPTPAPAERNCNPNYSGCLLPNASDYDCEGGRGNGPYYTGPVQVLGYDQYDLDRDNDGWGCE